MKANISRGIMLDDIQNQQQQPVDRFLNVYEATLRMSQRA